MTETTTVKKCGNKLAGLSLLLSLAAIGASGYLYYMGMQYKHQAELQMGIISVQGSTQSQVNLQAINELQDSLGKTNSRLTEISGNKSGLLMFQINELISLANQGLVVYSDVPGCIRLLNYAKNILDTNNDAQFTSLKLALSNDLTKLNSLTPVDKVIISGELDSMASEISSLHLDAINSEAIAKAEATGSKWSKFWENIKSNLMGLVNVSKTAQNQNVLLPKQEVIIQDAIRIDLLSAKMALLEHDQAGWEYSINNARDLVSTGFANYSGVNKITERLTSLLQLKVNNTNANIDSTLAQLIKLNNLQ